MRKRVLFISYTAGWTGPTHSLLLLLRHVHKRFDVAVLLPGHGDFSQTLEDEGIPYFSLPRLNKWAIPAMIRLIRRERFDLVYGNNVSSSSRNALIAARVMRVPFVCHVRDMGGSTWRNWGFLRFATAVIAVSEAAASAAGKFVPQRRLHMVYNWVELDMKDGAGPVKETKGLDDASDLPSSTPLLVGIAHIRAGKGITYAVEAMSRVVQDVPQARLLLIGALDREPDYVERVRVLIEEKGLQEHVELAGFQRDVQPFLEKADIFIHTSMSEGLPRVVIEAMAAKLPVVAFAVDGVTETVEHGQTGYLVPGGDVDSLAGAINELIDNPPLRKEMGSAGRRRVEQLFSAAASADKVADIIEHCLRR